MLKLNIQSTVMMIEEDQKPPIETVMAALRAAAAYIERIHQEPRIQTVLEEVRKLASDTCKRDTEIEEKITHIKHQSRSNAFPPSLCQRVGTRSGLSGLHTNRPPQSGMPVPIHGQAPYNKMNETIVKIHDEAASKALQKKTPAAMTSLVNEYIRNKVWVTQGSLPERRGDWERCTYLFRRFLFECFASGKVPSLLAVLIGFLVESMLLMHSLTISVPCS